MHVSSFTRPYSSSGSLLFFPPPLFFDFTGTFDPIPLEFILLSPLRIELLIHRPSLLPRLANILSHLVLLLFLGTHQEEMNKLNK